MYLQLVVRPKPVLDSYLIYFFVNNLNFHRANNHCLKNDFRKQPKFTSGWYNCQQPKTGENRLFLLAVPIRFAGELLRGPPTKIDFHQRTIKRTARKKDFFAKKKSKSKFKPNKHIELHFQIQSKFKSASDRY